MISLDELNRLPPEQFVTTLDGIFENSPWIAAHAAQRRPFNSRLQLLDAMRAVVDAATADAQLALINAHPKLGVRGRTRQQLTQASSREQQRVGLDACSDAQLAHLERINAAYIASFGFPFILAVRGHDPPSIIAHMERRLRHERSREIRAALDQIGMIAGYRLADVVASSAATEIRAMIERLPGMDGARLVREWMLAAGLTVWCGDGEGMLGLLSGTGVIPKSVLIGAHYDAGTRKFVYGGQLGWASGIAIAQQLKEQGIRLAVDLAVFALPHDHRPGAVSDLVRLDSRSGGIAVECIGGSGVDVAPLLAAVRAAALRQVLVPVVSPGMAAEPSPRLEQAMGALLQFLLHIQG